MKTVLNSYLVNGQTGGTIDTEYNGRPYSFQIVPRLGIAAEGVIFVSAKDKEANEALKNSIPYRVKNVVTDYKMGIEDKNEALLPDDDAKLFKMFGERLGNDKNEISAAINKFEPDDYEKISQYIHDLLALKVGANVAKESDDTTGIVNASLPKSELATEGDDEFVVVDDTPEIPVEGGNSPSEEILTKSAVNKMNHEQLDALMTSLGIEAGADATCKMKRDAIIASQKL